jgi:hypothetical protein
MQAPAGDQAAEPAREDEPREYERTLSLGQVGVDASPFVPDAEAAKATGSAEDPANEAIAAIDASPIAPMQAASATVEAASYDAMHEPIHAPGRAPASPQALASPASPAGSRPSRKSSRLALAAVLAAVVVGSAAWYAARPELAPLVAALQANVESIVSPLKGDTLTLQPETARESEPVSGEHESGRRVTEAVKAEALATQLSADADAGQQVQASEAERVEQQRMLAEAARLAEEQRKKEQAQAAERERRLALVRQKEEAARGAASENYELATVLLKQGRNREAVRLLRELALNGHGPAAKTLGDLYSNGDKVSVDMQEAAFYYAVAERNGVKMDGPAFAYR